MLFTSMEFMFAFFPAAILIYFVLGEKYRNPWLLLISLFFYAWGEPRFVLVMLASIGLNYLTALGIAALRGKRMWPRLLLAAGVCVNLGLLFVFKYLNFATATLHRFFPQTQSLFPATHIALPIGISFFTFQALSYVIDVYRGLPVQKNILNLALYISLFPQLIAGPIVRYTTVMEQLKKRTVSLEKFTGGLHRFLIGFNKKILLANVLAVAADGAFNASSRSAAMSWLGAVCYALQIYYDFSGYSDMAIGLGRVFGFEFLENFNYPYVSRTITEFWRRWHISLGSWFRDYVYFPLGGSRVKTRRRLVFNLGVVWMATGIWHGASWNFILWGMLYGMIIIFEKLTDLPGRLPRHKGLALGYRVFAMLAVLVGWVLFRANGLSAAAGYLKTMLGLGGAPLLAADAVAAFRDFGITMLLGVAFSTPLAGKIKDALLARFPSGEPLIRAAALGVQALLFVVSVSFLAMEAHNPFIYFNF